MALFYKKIQRGNPSNPSAPKKWYLTLKSLGMMKEREVAQEISSETTLNPKEAEMALYQFQKVMLKALLDGKTVQLGELGSFNLTLNSEGSDQEKDAIPSKIKQVNLNFSASSKVRAALQNANFKPAKDL